MIRILRELWLFFWRDLSIARTYRTVFVLEAIEALFGAAMFYYVARLWTPPRSSRLCRKAAVILRFHLSVSFFLII